MPFGARRDGWLVVLSMHAISTTTHSLTHCALCTVRTTYKHPPSLSYPMELRVVMKLRLAGLDGR